MTPASFVNYQRQPSPSKIKTILESTTLWKVILNIVILFFFAIIYTFIIDTETWSTSVQPEEGSDYTTGQKLKHGIYNSVIIHTTVGFGDFYPKTSLGQIFVMIHALSVFFINMVL